MANHDRPTVECHHHHTGVNVADVDVAVAFYVGTLGFEHSFTWGNPPALAGVKLGDAEIFLQRGAPDPSGCTLYFVVDDADGLFAFQRDRGVEVVTEPGDRAYGIRDYAVRDLHGYELLFGHYIHTVGDPVPIERVDVPVRLERRLAALLHDLAAHKRMSLDSCLEEILLHTCEPYGDGVASPHTKSQLRHIQELKERHGIDYDCHASYRFVEESGPPG